MSVLQTALSTRYRNLEKLHLPPRPPDAMAHLIRILDAWSMIMARIDRL